MGAVSVTGLAVIPKTVVSVSSRFTSSKGTDLATYIQNRGSHYEFLETQSDKRCSEIIKATTLVGACKDTPWLQVTCTVSLPTPTIIGSYKATKNHLIAHITANNAAVRIGNSICQFATNPL